jgi:hypothetical protein
LLQAVDWWGVGVAAYELFTRRAPFIPGRKTGFNKEIFR